MDPQQRQKFMPALRKVHGRGWVCLVFLVCACGWGFRMFSVGRYLFLKCVVLFLAGGRVRSMIPEIDAAFFVFVFVVW